MQSLKIYISVTTPSRASSHKINAAAEHLRGSKTPPTCGSDPQGLKTRRTCGSELAHEEAGAVAENLYIRDYAFASKLAPTRSALLQNIYVARK
ncbi:hypothetical protein GIW00_28785, partial [Pseudomonas syringae]|nr:hypothetical protein [Pseudomonas syringae]